MGRGNKIKAVDVFCPRGRAEACHSISHKKEIERGKRANRPYDEARDERPTRAMRFIMEYQEHKPYVKRPPRRDTGKGAEKKARAPQKDDKPDKAEPAKTEKAEPAKRERAEGARDEPAQKRAKAAEPAGEGEGEGERATRKERKKLFAKKKKLEAKKRKAGLRRHMERLLQAAQAPQVAEDGTFLDKAEKKRRRHEAAPASDRGMHGLGLEPPKFVGIEGLDRKLQQQARKEQLRAALQKQLDSSQD